MAKFTKILFAVLLLGVPLLLGGCLESDVLVQYVQDQDKGEVNPEIPEKIYIPDSNSDLTVDDIAAESNQSKDDLQKAVYDQAIFDTNANTDESAEETSRSTDARSLSTTKKQKASDKGEKKKTGKKLSDKDGSGGSGSLGGTNPNAGENGGKDSKVNQYNNVYDASFGNLEDLPADIGKACAVGEAATIVLSIAGKGALTGSSEEYLSDSQIKTVFADRDIDKVKVCWSDDGLGAGEANISAIVKTKADAVLTLSGTKTVTTAQEKELGKEGIRVIVLPSMASDDNITAAVRAVGKLFSESTNNASTSRASDYEKKVTSILGTAKSAHGGGVATYRQRDYNDASNKQKEISNVMADPNWCIYLSNWDDDATVSATFNSATLFSKVTGVASTYTGWDWSPISYYMSCGGTINNAAAYGDAVRTTARRPFLQYNENQVHYEWISKPRGTTIATDDRVLYKDARGNGVLANRYDAYDSEDKNLQLPLGQGDFNKVFVRTKNIKKKFKASQSEGLYAPGSWCSTGTNSGYGRIIGSNQLLYSYTIGADSSRESDIGYEVIVNPTGMVGSWTNGSMEGCLESLWITHEYYPSKETTGELREEISSFYDEFYGYTPTEGELDNILDGTYAG